MSSNSVVLSLTLENCIKISKWKVKEGMFVSVGRIILLYDPSPGNGKPEVQRLKATAVGTVRKLLAKEGDVVQPGHPLLALEKCKHPTVMKDMCAECGADLRNEGAPIDNVASIPMIHSIPELKVNAEQAQILGKADEERLLATKKLVLLVDLDQTLIHTTNDNIPPNLKDVFHFRLHGSMSPWHHTRLRPGTKKFLKEMSKLYELHICTFGSRMYAHMIAKFLDPDGQYFSHRILSRDECVSANSKTANLKALFPCGDEMVCIIDDREDVWNFAPNLIHVKPYHFFQHTGDINAPPGLSKQENDDKGDYDFSCLGDGKKGKDILRPNLPETSQESRKETADLVKLKGENATSEDSDPIAVINDNSSMSDETPNEILKTGKDVVNDEMKEKKTSAAEKNEHEPNLSKESNVDIDKPELTLDYENSKHEKITEDLCLEAPKDIENNEQKPEDSEPVEDEQNPEDSEPVKDEQNPEDSEPVEDERNPEDSEPVGDKQNPEDSERVEDKQNPEDSEPLEDKQNPEDSEPVEDKQNTEDSESVKDEKSSDEIQNDEEKADVPEPLEPGIIADSSSDLSVKATKISKSTGKIGSDKTADDEIEVPDHDDYLLYLEEILRRIHKEFYDRQTMGQKPDMKYIIPAVRKKVLQGTNLVFSGLVPNNIPLERSRAYQVAISLGANVTQDLKKNTTHLVAVRPGTAKVNSARRMKNVLLVTADWLWVSAERWERVDEKVFPLGRNRAGTRHPPAHCGSPEHTPVARDPSEPSTSSGRSRTASGRFMDTINPLLSFSSADIADMDQEVDDIFRESESDGDGEEKERPPKAPEMESGSDEETKPSTPSARRTGGKEDEDSESSSSSADSLSGEHPHGWGKHDLKRKRPDHKLCTGTATESDGDEEADDMPSTKFRRGEALPSDLDLGENESDSPRSEDAPDEMDDGDWNMMGAALEREFLS